MPNPRNMRPVLLIHKRDGHGRRDRARDMGVPRVRGLLRAEGRRAMSTRRTAADWLEWAQGKYDAATAYGLEVLHE